MKEFKKFSEFEKEELSFEQAFKQLQEILAILSEKGYTIPDYCYVKEKIQKDWENGLPFPIAREGLDGIRVSKTHNSGFRVWFTNGFEDKNNPKRVEISNILRDKGFDVV